MDEARLSFQRCNLDLWLFDGNSPAQCLGAVLESLVEGLQVQFTISLRDRITDSVSQRIRFEQLRNGSEETNHHDVEHHLLAQRFGDTCRRDAVNPHSR